MEQQLTREAEEDLLNFNTSFLFGHGLENDMEEGEIFDMTVKAEKPERTVPFTRTIVTPPPDKVQLDITKTSKKKKKRRIARNIPKC